HKLDEDERLFGKHAAGCRFFISQTVFDASSTKSLLSDYALRFARAHLAPVPFILSFSPCGSLKTMEFMKWLGISFPRWRGNHLATAPPILRKSVGPARAAFGDGRAFPQGKGGPPRAHDARGRHQRRERVDPQGRDRGIGRAVSSAVGDDVARVPRGADRGQFWMGTLTRA